MKKLMVVCMLVVFSNCVCAQYSLTRQQQYLIDEWKDAYGGQIYYAYNYPKTYDIYKKLVRYSGMQYPIVFGQTFNWGQAHNGGLIILDYSSINKNPSILAFVFAHEWGHQALGHQANIYHPSGSNWKFRSSSTETEDEADVYSGKFLATYGYDINMVCNYLHALPASDDHTHSSGSDRARLVRRGYNAVKGSSATPTPSGSMPSGPTYRTVVVSCAHIAHPNGDVSTCYHKMHPNGDVFQCSHSCFYPGYGYGPCHPSGDLFPCSHPLHYNGDISACIHKLHPAGDTQQVRVD